MEKRTNLKKYITIQLDQNELAKRSAVKQANRISDRKIYMAMINAMIPQGTDVKVETEIQCPPEVKVKDIRENESEDEINDTPDETNHNTQPETEILVEEE